MALRSQSLVPCADWRFRTLWGLKHEHYNKNVNVNIENQLNNCGFNVATVSNPLSSTFPSVGNKLSAQVRVFCCIDGNKSRCQLLCWLREKHRSEQGSSSEDHECFSAESPLTDLITGYLMHHDGQTDQTLRQWYQLVQCVHSVTAATEILREHELCVFLLFLILLSLRNSVAKRHLRVSQIHEASAQTHLPSYKWNGSSTGQLEDFLVFLRRLCFICFLLAVKPSWLSFYTLIKCLSVFSAAVGMWPESCRQIWQDSCRETWFSSNVLLWTFEINLRQTDRETDRQVPELSDSLNRPQQKYLLHCFWTFSFSAQWKMNMNRPGAGKQEGERSEIRAQHRTIHNTHKQHWPAGQHQEQKHWKHTTPEPLVRVQIGFSEHLKLIAHFNLMSTICMLVHMYDAKVTSYWRYHHYHTIEMTCSYYVKKKIFRSEKLFYSEISTMLNKWKEWTPCFDDCSVSSLPFITLWPECCIKLPDNFAWTKSPEAVRLNLSPVTSDPASHSPQWLYLAVSWRW